MYTSCISGRDPEKLSKSWKLVKPLPFIPFPPIDKKLLRGREPVETVMGGSQAKHSKRGCGC